MPTETKDLDLSALCTLMSAAVDELKSKRIVKTPVSTNRASDLGSPCLRYLYYARENWRDRELHNLDLQYIFDEGNNQERITLKDLQDAGELKGFDIVGSQQFFKWDAYNITGHIDGKVRHKETGLEVPVEIKSMSPFIWDNIEKLEDFYRYSWTAKYLAQITLYMLLLGEDKAIFILKNKSTGKLRFIPVYLDCEIGEELIKKAEAVNKAIADKTPPDRIPYSDTCKKCAFKTLCLENVDLSAGIDIENDPELEKKLKRREELISSYKEYTALDKEVKKTVEGKAGVIIGDFKIDGKYIDRKGYTVEAKSYWRAEIVQLPGEPTSLKEEPKAKSKTRKKKEA